MDFQKMVDNSIIAQRNESMKTSKQLTLGEIILKLEHTSLKEKDGTDKTIAFGFGYFKPNSLSSWRGNYRELAIEYTEEGNDILAKDFLKECKKAIGKTYQGYKGGDFIMGKTTPMWVANYGESPNTAVTDIIDKDYWVLIKTEYIEY